MAWPNTTRKTTYGPNASQNTDGPRGDGHLISTDFLIVGAGPAGAGLASFLGSHGNPHHPRIHLAKLTPLPQA
jgi:hypothetical protein